MATARPPRRLVTRLLATVALVVGSLGGLLLGAPPASAAPGQYFDGAPAYSMVTNCVSIIQGAPYQEYGMGTFVGSWVDPDAQPAQPYVGQAFYVHLYVLGMGNNCQGYRFVPALSLPAGVQLATNDAIRCVVDSGEVFGADCPQWDHVSANPFWGGQFAYYSTDSANANTWPMAQGSSWDFYIPVVSSVPLTGASLHAFVWTADGNASPVLTPSSQMYVFNGTGSGSPSILYDVPSTVEYHAIPPNGAAPPAYGVLSWARYVTQGVGGQGGFEIGTSPGSYVSAATFPIAAGSASTTGWNDWEGMPGFPALSPGATYYWRAYFVSSGGVRVNGAEQVLRMLLSQVCHGKAVTVALSLGEVPTAGDDVIMGTNATEAINGLGGNDTICAMGGNDTVTGGPGDDVIDGGTGIDTASYDSAPARVLVSLANAAAQSTGGAGLDTLAAWRICPARRSRTASPEAVDPTGSSAVVAMTRSMVGRAMTGWTVGLAWTRSRMPVPLLG